MSAKVPEELYRRATEVPASENIYVDKLLASAFEERVLELSGSKSGPPAGATRNFCVVMSKVPAAPLIGPGRSALLAHCSNSVLTVRNSRSIPDSHSAWNVRDTSTGTPLKRTFNACSTRFARATRSPCTDLYTTAEIEAIHPMYEHAPTVTCRL